MSLKSVLYANKVVISQVHKNILDLVFNQEFYFDDIERIALQKMYGHVVKLEVLISEIDKRKGDN